MGQVTTETNLDHAGATSDLTVSLSNNTQVDEIVGGNYLKPGNALNQEHTATIGDTKSSFTGSGGVSARAAFLFSLTLIPGVMLAMGLIEVLAHYGALRAAQVLLTPLLKPLLGLPGFTGLALITDLQSTDGGAAITRSMYDNGQLPKKGLITMCAWQYAGAGCINNYYTTVSALFFMFTCPVWMPVIIILALKFVGGMLVRFILNTVYRKDFAND